MFLIPLLERPYECASTSARLKYQVVPDTDKRQEMFYNPICQALRCMNIVITPFRDKVFGHKLISEPIVVFGIIVNIKIVATFMTSDRIEYFGYGNALSIALSPKFQQPLQMGSVVPQKRTWNSKEPLNRPTTNPKTF